MSATSESLSPEPKMRALGLFGLEFLLLRFSNDTKARKRRVGGRV
jgi:hypothetical protein